MPAHISKYLLAAGCLLFGAGLALGVMLGKSSSNHKAQAVDRKQNSEESRDGAGKSALKRSSGAAEVSKILLGNIAAVPFQELYGVMAARSAEELTEASEQLKILPAGLETNKKITAFFKAWGQLDAKAAFPAALTFANTESRRVALAALISGADSTSAEWLARSLNAAAIDVVPAERRGLIGEAALKWSELDAASAAKFLDSLPLPGGKFFGDLYTIAANWALVDPAAAMAWAQQHDVGNSFRMTSNGALSGWWQKDPRAAEAYVLSHLDGMKGWEVATVLASQMFNADPRHALEWVSQLPNQQARMHAEQIIANQMSWTDPKRASVWALNLPATERTDVLYSVVAQWAQGDAGAAAEWVGTLNGPDRDQGVRGLSTGLAISDPLSAINWAASISDSQVRDRTVDNVVTTWMRENSSDATAWVQASNLTDERKKKLLASGGHGG